MYRLIPLTVLILSLLGCSKATEVNGFAAVTTRVEATVSSVTSGSVDAEHEVELAFGTVGRVSVLNVKLGSAVKKGDILAELENLDLRQALTKANSDLARARALLRSKVLASSESEEALKVQELAHANYEKSLIRAPFDGVVAEINLEVGQLSQITAVIPLALIRLVDLEPRFVKAEIDEVDMPKVTLGLPARIKILAVRREPFNGTVRKLVPFVSAAREQDRTSPIELTLNTEGALLPVGASADVEILTDTRHDVLAVPSRAVFGRGGNRYVFKLTGSTATKTSIEIGLSNYDRTEIKSGLQNGDIVLTPRGSDEIVDGGMVKEIRQPWP
jgi:HlyD family secretion protein